MDEPGFTFKHATVAIVGLGLMGGSLALALRAQQACTKIIAIERDEATRQQALARGTIDLAYDDLSAVAQADLIVLATPVRAIIELVPRIGAHARANAIVIDLGSTKQAITQAMQALPAHVQAIGGHPMCGKETAGFSAADAAIFRNAVFVLTPLARTSPQTLTRVQALVAIIGARAVVMDAEKHDRIVAAISHLPYTLACALMLTTIDLAREEEELYTLAASGLRDTSRLAASDVTMMLDILMTNRDNVAELMRGYARQLEQLAATITRGDENNLRASMEQAAAERRALFNGTAPSSKA